jgi:hypothetical protein
MTQQLIDKVVGDYDQGLLVQSLNNGIQILKALSM